MYGKFCILLSKKTLYYRTFFYKIELKNYTEGKVAQAMSRIRKIAVFISHIYGDYQRNVCQGVIDKATEYGYHVDVFTSNDERILGKYSTGEFDVLRIPNPESYGGAIISSNTYLVPELGQQIIDALQKWNCPVIDINSTVSPFPRVLLDNNAAIADLVKHLATVHELRRICYLGNTVEWYFSCARESHYKEAMDSLGLSDNVRMFEADYSREGICAALDQILLTDPQAIICYNDNMAFTVMSELAAKGIRIPSQIAITGCDNLEFGQNITPSLTTVTFPTYEMGERAFLLLLEQLDHATILEAPVVKAVPRFGASCGCTASHNVTPILFSTKLKGKTDSLEAIALENIHMSSTLQGQTDIDEAMDLLADFVVNFEKDQGIKGLRECYFCLYSDWEQISNHVRNMIQMEDEPETDKILLKLGIRDKIRLPECSFTREDCLPEFLRDNGNDVYVFTPLFFGDHSFGYLCESFEKNIISYPFSFVSCLQNMNSMLQSISDNKNMQLMLNRLDDIYSHDSLTGLYNLHRFKILTPGFLEKAAQQNSSVVTIVLDMDRLKSINDKYGHEEGNVAIQVLGQAINQNCNENLIACRFGGDEFYLLGTGMDDIEAQNIILRIQRYLEHYNDTSSKPYHVTASGGCAICKGYTEDDLNEAFKAADQKMYAQKQLRHKS